MLNRVEKDTIEDKPLRIGTLLVGEGFIRNADLDMAMKIQENEARLAELPLGKLLVRKKLIDRDQLQALLQHPELVGEIETFAVEKARVHPRDLARCIEEKPAPQPLPEALVAGGHLTDDDLKRFFLQQLDSLKICELAVETGMVSEQDINRVLRSKHTPRTIGEILCDLNLITPLDLNAVLAKYQKHLRLGEILLKHELVGEADFHRALEMHEREGKPLGSILCREGILSEDQLYGAFARQYNLPFEKLEGFQYSAGQRDALSKIVGKTFSDQFHIVPLRLEENSLTVGVSDPATLEIVHSLRSKRVDLRTGCVLVAPSTMERLYEGLYGTRPPFRIPDQTRSPAPSSAPAEKAPEPSQEPPDTGEIEPPVSADAEATPSQAIDTSESPRPLAEDPSETPSASAGQWVNRILQEALSRSARAIHIDQGLRRTTMQFRIGDTLQHPLDPWPDEAFQEMAGRIVSTVKEIAGMDTGSRHRPQEGIFRAGMAGSAATAADLDFSVTSCPTLAGENITIRRISPGSPAPNLDELPHSRHVVASLQQVMKHITGMILVAAPPGHGRAATLYAMLRHIYAPQLKAVTVDEAISFSMPEAVQTQANPSMGLSYAGILRAALRLDPDVMLAEDLGTPESAELGIEAVRRGILLLGGINAADSAAAVSMMGGLGRELQTAGFLKAVLAQRYVRKICPACKQSYTPSFEEWQPLFEHLPKGVTFYRGAGCPECDFTGFRGRILLSELLVIGDAIVRAMKQQLSENDIRHLVIRSGARTLIDDGLSKLGETTLSEIVDAVPREAADAFKCSRADARPASPPAPAGAPEPRKKTTGFGITLSAEEIPGAELRQLHKVYEVLMEETGHRTRPSNPGAFETFIKAHQRAVCRRFGCDRVSFSVERKEGTVLLTARPVM